ncbi:MAG: Ig domain-containing protein [Clostridia bacterium]|nr:Ig domain-containing protein [Clostridia bacterium]
MKKISVLVAVLAIAVVLGVGVAAIFGEESDNGMRLIVPEDWELEVGDSRTVDYIFDSDAVTNRMLTWTSSDEDIAIVDKWGRVTAVGVGKAKITAETSDGLYAHAKLNAVEVSESNAVEMLKVDYNGGAVSLGSNLQKVVTRYEISTIQSASAIPQAVKDAVESGDYADLQIATTADGAVWEITSYGVLRTDDNAKDSRDKEQRFMGDRYFYSKDTTTGKVFGIYPDGKNGIWTIMSSGVTHIEMLKITGTDKATMMVEQTQEYVMRHGYVSEAYYNGSTDSWKGIESDNDGLWTSMYAAGELMRYASLKKSGTATKQEIEEARSSAMISTEAVLLLSNISMREGTVEAYVRYQPNGRFDEYSYGSNTANGRYQSQDAVEKDGDYSINMPSVSPAEAFNIAYDKFINEGEMTYFLVDGYLEPFVQEDWSDPLYNEDGSVSYETRTRLLKGYIARTYSTADENHIPDEYIHYQFKYDEEGRLIAEGVSTMKEHEGGYYINGENLRGIEVDASGEIPARLWNDLKAAGEINDDTTITDIFYKGDTSSDEIIGHMFLYKLAYDILGSEDAEIKKIISNTMDNFCQHLTDNGYMMVDASGQPGTWSKFNRAFFYNSSQLGGAPLTASVALCAFKVGYYVTGNQKWENEYRMAALDPAYEYAKLMTQYYEQCYLYMMTLLDQYLNEFVPGLITVADLKKSYDLSPDSKLTSLLLRLFINYSDEEMAMLAYYTLFQLETDEELLGYYREGLNDWWHSIQYSENPLWYFIYQLAYPNETKYDAYGNSVVETAAWQLSRHPIDTRQYLASNSNRDDIAVVDLADMGLGEGAQLSYSIAGDNEKLNLGGSIMGIFTALDKGPYLEWDVAPADERSLHKYNGESYRLESNYNPYCMEGSTTYTLPYWMGIYHNLITDIA